MEMNGPARLQAPSWAAREVVGNRRVRIALGLAAFVLATTLGAYVAVPLPWTPVPMTLQPLFVLLTGVVLGPRLGAAAMLAYLSLGVAGAPVFSAGRAGLAHVLGPTGGYLVAFPPAAFVAGWLAGGARSGAVRLALALLAGLAVIYTGGVAQLVALAGEPLGRVLALAVWPFVGGDLVELLVALLVARRLRARTLGS